MYNNICHITWCSTSQVPTYLWQNKKGLTQMSWLLHLGLNNESQISNGVVVVQHVGKYIIYDILLEDIANPKSQHICGRTKRDWLKCHDCFILDQIMNHRSQARWWWSIIWANIDKRQGVWGSRLRFKLRTNPSGGEWANKNLGITNTVGVDIWESGWLENKISRTT